LKDEVWVRLLIEDCEENSDEAEKNIRLPYSSARSMPRGDSGEGVMQNPRARAEHYRKEAAKCHELAKYARPAYLGDFYRRVAMRYLSMAQDILREARERGEIAPERSRSALRVDVDAEPVGYRRKKRCSDLRTNTCPPNSMATVVDRDSGEMQDPVSKAEGYRREANKCAESARSVSPAFPGEIYQKIAVRTYRSATQTPSKGRTR
jgi:hypothetical protein